MSGENEGDNKEFYVHSVSDITVYIIRSGYTSANDTETEKYFDNSMTPIPSASEINIRNNQTIHILGYNGTAFTDPCTVIINKGHTEKWDSPIIHSIQIRTTVADTLLRVRFK